MVVAQQDREEVFKSVKKLEVNQDAQRICKVLCGLGGVRDTVLQGYGGREGTLGYCSGGILGDVGNKCSKKSK